MESVTTTPFLSVIIATYNRAENLRRAIQSALDEPGDYFEVIVGDDGSPDHTPDVVQAFAHDPRLRQYRNPVNLGMRENYLKIARAARGDYLVILTDDDWFVPGALQRIQAILSANPDTGYLLSDLPTVDERIDNRVVGVHRSFSTSQRLSPGIANMTRLVGSAWVLSRQVLKRELIDWVTWEKYRDNIFFPIIFAGRLLLKAPAYYLAEPLVMHTYFNQVFWQAFGRDQLEIDFNLSVDRYRCMRAILHDYAMTAQVRAVIAQWEQMCFKMYLYSESGLYFAIRQLGLRPALARVARGFQVGRRERLELGLFFVQLPFRRGWVGLKSFTRRRAPRLFFWLKALRDQTADRRPVSP